MAYSITYTRQQSSEALTEPLRRLAVAHTANSKPVDMPERLYKHCTVHG
jgi:hypothetical protein